MNFYGPVTVIQAPGNITVHIDAGGKVSTNPSAPKNREEWCDSNIRPDTLANNWRKIENAPPGDWHRSYWGGSDVIFGGATPAGLKKDDTLFYWKQGQHPAPDGWQILWEDHNTCIIPEVEQLDDDEDSDQYLNADEDVSPVPPGGDGIFDDDVDNDDDGDDIFP